MSFAHVFSKPFQDGIVCVWDLASYTLLRQFEPHMDRISSLALSPDGLRFVSCSVDMTFKVTELDSGMEILSADGDDAYKCMASDGTNVRRKKQ